MRASALWILAPLLVLLATLPLVLRRLRQEEGWKLVHLQWPESGHQPLNPDGYA